MAADERVLVVVAHPDDETFGCGSLIAHAARRGASVVVACATRGEAGTAAPGHEPPDGNLAPVREAELHAAAGLLGADRVVLFDWHDSDMEGEAAPGTLVAAPLDDVATVVAALVDDVRPTVVITLDASDGHRDHAKIRDATLAAVECSSWSVPRVYLQCLSRALMRQWMEELQRRDPGSDYLALGELGTPDEEVTTQIDSRDLLDLRDRAMALHASQVAPFEIMPEPMRRKFLTVERLRRIRPEWTGGPLETDVFGD
jgi:LmbE family N-acetylglucosaminyl deacetylase